MDKLGGWHNRVEVPNSHCEILPTPGLFGHDSFLCAAPNDGARSPKSTSNAACVVDGI